MSSLIAIVAGLTVLVLLAMACVRPGWALAAVITMLPMEQVLQSTIPTFIQTPWLYNGLVAVSCVVCLATKPMRGKSLQMLVTGPALLAAALIGLALLSLAWSPQIESVEKILRESIPTFFVAIFVLPALIDCLEDIRECAKVSIVVGLITSLGVLLNPAAKNVWGRLALELGPITGNFLCLSELGGILVLLGVLIRWPGTVGIGLRIAAVLLGAALFFSTGSRGQVIFSGVLSILFYPLAHPTRNIGTFVLNSVLLMVLAGIAVVGASLFVQQGSARRWNLAGQDFWLRIDFAVTLLSKWASEPSAWFTGLGIGSFYAFGFGGDYVHNTYIEALGEVGLIGFVLIGLVTAYGTTGFIRLYRTWSSSPEDRNSAAIVIALCAYQILLSFKQGSLLGANLLILFLLIGYRLVRVDEPGPSSDLDEQDDTYDPDWHGRPSSD